MLIITYNEEEMLEDCLESVTWADEIVVVDSDSEDKTREIAQNYTDKIYIRDFDNFSNQRNFGLDKIKTDWVLVLDADERVTAELAAEINKVISNKSNQERDLYQLPRKNFFLGRWIKYGGWYPDYTDRLFKNTADIRYTGDVHESPNFTGKKGRLEEHIIHYTYRDIAHYIKKINHYSTLNAIESSKKPSIFYVFIRPVWEFFQVYFLKRGFLLGKEGLIFAMISSVDRFLKYAKLWEKNQLKS